MRGVNAESFDENEFSIGAVGAEFDTFLESDNTEDN